MCVCVCVCVCVFCVCGGWWQVFQVVLWVDGACAGIVSRRAKVLKRSVVMFACFFPI